MKKLVSVILALVLLCLSICSCGRKKVETTTETTETTEIQTASDETASVPSDTVSANKAPGSSATVTVSAITIPGNDTPVQAYSENEPDVPSQNNGYTVSSSHYFSSDNLPAASVNPIKSLCAYPSLSETQKVVYKVINESVKSMSGRFIFSMACTHADICVAYSAVMNDYPEYFWMPYSYLLENDGANYYMVLDGTSGEGSDAQTAEYAFSSKQKSDMEAALNSKIEEIKGKIKGSNDFEKALCINNYICENTTYAYNDFSNPRVFTMYGALVEGKAVCEGYSKAMLYLCNLFGISSACVSGNDANGTEHMWNIVKIDGVWSHVDVTFNDSADGNFKTYFGLSDSSIQSNHIISRLYSSLSDNEIESNVSYNIFFPGCTSDTNNYFYRYGRVLTQNSSSDDSIAEAVAYDILQGTYYSDFSFIDNPPSKLNADYFNTHYSISGMINKINAMLSLNGHGEVSVKNYSFLGNSVRIFFCDK